MNLVVFGEGAGVVDMVLVSCVVFRRTSCIDGPVAFGKPI